jgi:HSP20 family protein
MGGQIMQLIKWNPSRDIFSLRNHFNTLFDDFFYPSRRTTAEEGMWNWNPAVDIYEEGDNIIVQAELPGVAKDGISVDVKDRVLTIKGERSADNEVKEDKYFRRERVYGQYRRAFTLPADVDPESVKAEYNDGVLKIMVPKPEAQKPKQITVH